MVFIMISSDIYIIHTVFLLPQCFDTQSSLVFLYVLFQSVVYDIRNILIFVISTCPPPLLSQLHSYSFNCYGNVKTCIKQIHFYWLIMFIGQQTIMIGA
jgi:hypothetical protein